jgi:hypothetical protein
MSVYVHTCVGMYVRVHDSAKTRYTAQAHTHPSYSHMHAQSVYVYVCMHACDSTKTTNTHTSTFSCNDHVWVPVHVIRYAAQAHALRLLQAIRILLLHNYTMLSCSNLAISGACLKRMLFATTQQSLRPYKRGVALKERSLRELQADDSGALTPTLPVCCACAYDAN